MAARRGSDAVEEPAQAAPDPHRPFRPESNHLRFWVLIGAERIERPPRDLQSRMLPLHHAPFPETAEHGEHPLSIRWEARHGPIRFLQCRGDAGHGI